MFLYLKFLLNANIIIYINLINIIICHVWMLADHDPLESTYKSWSHYQLIIVQDRGNSGLDAEF